MLNGEYRIENNACGKRKIPHSAFRIQYSVFAFRLSHSPVLPPSRSSVLLRRAAACIFLLLFNLASLRAAERVILLGFDGLDPDLVEQWKDHLPNFRKLREKGGMWELGTTTPCESPVAWTAVSTGVNPGRFGFFGFLKRAEGSYYPKLALVEKRERIVWQRYALAAAFALIGALGVLYVIRRTKGSKAQRLGGGGNGEASRHFVSRISYSVFRIPRSSFLLFPFRIAYCVLRILCLALPVIGVAGIVLSFLWIPAKLAVPVNGRKAEGFWQPLARAGKRSTVLFFPITFPAEEIKGGRMLSGLGTPDIRGANGTYTIYTTKNVRDADTEMGGKVVPLHAETFSRKPGRTVMPGTPETVVLGPTWNARTASCRIGVALCTVGVKGDARPMVNIEKDDTAMLFSTTHWSPWTLFRFAYSPLFSVSGIGRFRSVGTSDEAVYLSPVNLNPADPTCSRLISFPGNYAMGLVKETGPSPEAYLAHFFQRRFAPMSIYMMVRYPSLRKAYSIRSIKQVPTPVLPGYFKTLGWPVDTWAFTEGWLDEDRFLEDLDFTMKGQERILLNEIVKSDWDFFAMVFMGTDSAQHCLWHFMDEQHPMYDPKLAAKYGNAIRDVYKEADRITGEVMKLCPDATLLVMSDHGFNPFRKAVNLNAWLKREGFIAQAQEPPEKNLEQLYLGGQFWEGVDWSRTIAYSLGLGQVNVNLRGREPQGIIDPKDYDMVVESLRKRLLDLRDPATGERPISRVERGDRLYHGPFARRSPNAALDTEHTHNDTANQIETRESRIEHSSAPDLVVCFKPGYRISWQSTLGVTAGEVIFENRTRWSGDHCSCDPESTKGVLISNRKIAAHSPTLYDIAPTVLGRFGLEAHGLEGRDLFRSTESRSRKDVVTQSAAPDTK